MKKPLVLRPIKLTAVIRRSLRVVLCALALLVALSPIVQADVVQALDRPELASATVSAPDPCDSGQHHGRDHVCAHAAGHGWCGMVAHHSVPSPHRDRAPASDGGGALSGATVLPDLRPPKLAVPA